MTTGVIGDFRQYGRVPWIMGYLYSKASLTYAFVFNPNFTGFSRKVGKVVFGRIGARNLGIGCTTAGSPHTTEIRYDDPMQRKAENISSKII